MNEVEQDIAVTIFSLLEGELSVPPLRLLSELE